MSPHKHDSILIRLGKNYKQDRFYQIDVPNLVIMKSCFATFYEIISPFTKMNM